MRPILDVFNENYSKTTIEKYIKNGIIEISPLIYKKMIRYIKKILIIVICLKISPQDNF